MHDFIDARLALFSYVSVRGAGGQPVKRCAPWDRLSPPSAEAMAAAAEAAQRAASGEVDKEHGTVRIAASNMVGAEVLPSILADFHASHPRIAVELALSNRNEDLLRGDADIAVRMG